MAITGHISEKIVHTLRLTIVAEVMNGGAPTFFSIDSTQFLAMCINLT